MNRDNKSYDKKYINKEKSSKTNEKKIFKNEKEKKNSSIENILNKIFKNELISFDEKKFLNFFYQNTKNPNKEKANLELKNFYVNLHKFFNLKSQLNSKKLFTYIKKIIGKNIYTIKNYINIIKKLENENFDLKNNYKNEKKKVVIHVKKLENKIRELQIVPKNNLLFDTREITKLIKDKENFIKELIKKRKFDKMKFNSFYIENFLEKSNLLKIINSNTKIKQNNYEAKIFNEIQKEKAEKEDLNELENFLNKKKKNTKFLKMFENELISKKDILQRIEEKLKEEDYKDSSFVKNNLFHDRENLNLKIQEVQNQIDELKIKNQKDDFILEDFKNKKSKEFEILEIEIMSEYKLLKSNEDSFKIKFDKILKNFRKKSENNNYFERSKNIIKVMNFFLDFDKNDNFGSEKTDNFSSEITDNFSSEKNSENDEDFLNSEIMKQKFNFYHKGKNYDDLKLKIDNLKKINAIYKNKINENNSEINILKQNENMDKTEKRFKNEIINVFSKNFVFKEDNQNNTVKINFLKTLKNSDLNDSEKIENENNEKIQKFILQIEKLKIQMKENEIIFQSRENNFKKIKGNLKKKFQILLKNLFTKFNNLFQNLKKEKKIEKIFIKIKNLDYKIKSLIFENKKFDYLKTFINIKENDNFENKLEIILINNKNFEILKNDFNIINLEDFRKEIKNLIEIKKILKTQDINLSNINVFFENFEKLKNKINLKNVFQINQKEININKDQNLQEIKNQIKSIYNVEIQNNNIIETIKIIINKKSQFKKEILEKIENKFEIDLNKENLFEGIEKIFNKKNEEIFKKYGVEIFNNNIIEGIEKIISKKKDIILIKEKIKKKYEIEMEQNDIIGAIEKIINKKNNNSLIKEDIKTFYNVEINNDNIIEGIEEIILKNNENSLIKEKIKKHYKIEIDKNNIIEVIDEIISKNSEILLLKDKLKNYYSIKTENKNILEIIEEIISKNNKNSLIKAKISNFYSIETEKKNIIEIIEEIIKKNNQNSLIKEKIKNCYNIDTENKNIIDVIEKITSKKLFDYKRDLSVLNEEYGNLMNENDNYASKCLEFQEEIIIIKNELKKKEREISQFNDYKKDMERKRDSKSAKKIGNMKKNLKDLQNKLENLKIIIQAFGLNENDKNLKKSFLEKLKLFEKNPNIINYKIFEKKNTNLKKNNNVFNSIKEELTEYNFDYMSSIDKSLNLNDSRENKTFDKKFNHFYNQFDKAQSENIKTPLKSKFVTTFNNKKEVLDKNEQGLDNIFDDAFNEFI